MGGQIKAKRRAKRPSPGTGAGTGAGASVADRAAQLGRAAHARGAFAEAAQYYATAAQAEPGARHHRRNAAACLARAGDFVQAAALYESLWAQDPQAVEVLGDLARVEVSLQRWASAIAHCRAALAAGQGGARIHCLLGRALAGAGDGPAALAAFGAALACDPEDYDTCLFLGRTLLDRGDPAGALDGLTRASRLRPEAAEALYWLGVARFRLGQMTQAAQSLLRAIEIAPGHSRAYYLLSRIELAADHRAEACLLLERAVACDPGNAEALASLLHESARLGDWARIARHAARIDELGLTGLPVHPFSLLGFDDDPDRGARRLRAFVAATPLPRDRMVFAAPAARPARLKVGYFSADFHDHATMHLMGRMFELLDRERFEPMIFSYGRSGADAQRRRLERAGLPVFDIRAMGDAEAVAFARARGLDIAIDLKGHTEHSRIALFAPGLAPVQISYLGFPGSTGFPGIDYAIADKIVLPEAERRFWSEKIICLPHSYQVTDNTRKIADPRPGRAMAGLPATGFVFASFNHVFKISPREFAVWGRILQQVPESVLWLFAPFDGVADNLRRNAPAFGIAPERLIFAPLVPQAEHLARLSLADLFLDSFTCNAHTTASDALWAGLPLLTLPGRAFQARVAASLLSAAGLPELVAESAAAYEAMAVAIATTPGMVGALKARLAETRSRAALFDTEGFTRDFERGLDLAYGRFLAGLPPDHIEVPSGRSRGGLAGFARL